MQREYGTLLVVDDNDYNRDMLARRLERRGYTVRIANGGLQALEMIAQAPVDLVLLDIMMPDIDGLTVLDTLRRTYTSTALPIIMATVKDHSTDVAEALQRGANDYITKPIDFPVALARIRLQLAHKRAEEALVQARNRALEQAQQQATFLANMSHEIRTPMNGILGVSQLLQETSLSAEQQEYAETITSSAKALLGIVNDILDFSKIGAEKLTLDREPFELHQVLEGVLDVLAPQASAKSLELLASVAPEVPPMVCGDAGRLRQILINLLGNAIKFTACGEVHVQVTALEVNPLDVSLRYAVSDTGIGLSSEEQQNIFQPFTQANAATSRQYGGTGLGLAICRQLVELMGGDIGVTSTPQQGTTFWFTLCCARPIGMPEPATPPRLSPARFLVVQDNATLGAWIQQEMTALGLQSDVVIDDAAALHSLRQQLTAAQPYDGVCIDLARPTVRGDALLQALRNEPCWQTLPVIGLLAWGQHPQEQPHLRTLVKPLKRAAFQHSLTGIVGKSSAPLPSVAGTTARHGAFSEENPCEGHARLLLVEDHPVNQLLALRMLRRLGYHTDVANNGAEALTALAQNSYDLILMDCQMPIMDGYATTLAIRQQDTPYRNIPIIAMTATYGVEDQQHFRDVGMNDYVSKPANRQYLHEVLQRWLPQDKQAAGKDPARGPS